MFRQKWKKKITLKKRLRHQAYVPIKTEQQKNKIMHNNSVKLFFRIKFNSWNGKIGRRFHWQKKDIGIKKENLSVFEQNNKVFF